MAIKFYIFLFLIFLISGCNKILSIGKPIINNKNKAKFILNDYKHNSLFFNSYMYFHDSAYQGRRGGISFAPQDSILNIIKSVLLNQQQLSIRVSDSLINRISPEIYDLGWFLKVGKINDDMILKYIPDSNSYIFPVLSSIFSHRHTMSSGYSGGWVYSASDQIRLIIFIIDKKQVIYKRSTRLFSSHVQDPNNPNQNLRTIKQEHWQLIIDKALEDYIKRLKVPAHKLEQNN